MGPPTVPASVLELARHGPAPLAAVASPSQASLHIATLIPSFRRGSGGHGTVVNLTKELILRGHSVSLWLDDFELLHASQSGSATRRDFSRFFDAAELPLRTDFSSWRRADLVLATGWQTVPRALLLPGVASRAYLVQDHEPDFYGASAQALLAAGTYEAGLHCIAASAWLAELLRARYGASASAFDLAVNHRTYHPAAEERRNDLIVFYARSATARRAVPLGLLALQELAHRRPGVEIALFGSDDRVHAPFPHTHLGVLEPSALAALYQRAAVGMVFSVTNPSLIGLEMMACGLPCVELATEPVLDTFSRDGALKLAAPDPVQICSALEQLLDDGAERRQRADAGLELMRSRTWSLAAQKLEMGLRLAMSSSGA